MDAEPAAQMLIDLGFSANNRIARVVPHGHRVPSERQIAVDYFDANLLIRRFRNDYGGSVVAGAHSCCGQIAPIGQDLVHLGRHHGLSVEGVDHRRLLR